MTYVISVLCDVAPHMYVGRSVRVGPYWGKLPKAWKVHRLIDARQWTRQRDAERFMNTLRHRGEISEELRIIGVAGRDDD